MTWVGTANTVIVFGAIKAVLCSEEGTHYAYAVSTMQWGGRLKEHDKNTLKSKEY